MFRRVDLRQCVFILTTNEKGDELAAMVAKMEAEGVLHGRDEMPDKGGTVSRLYTRRPKP